LYGLIDFLELDFVGNFISSIFFVLLVLMLSFPKSFSMLKLLLLAFLLFSVFFVLISKRYKGFSKDVLVFYLAFPSIALVWIFIGVLNGGYPIALSDAFRLYVIFPLLFLFLFLWLGWVNYIALIFYAVMLSTSLIFTTSILTILEALFSVVIFPEYLRAELNIMVGIHGGHFQLGNNNVNSLFFTVPFLLSLFVFPGEYAKKHRILFNIVLALGVLSVLLAGRRALMLLLILVPFIALLFRRLSCVPSSETGKSRVVFLFLLFVFCVVGVVWVADLDMSLALERIESAFDGDSVRVEQFVSLWNGFTESPVLGSGFGGSVDVIRSEERPWMYELSYMQLLFNGGVLGFSLVVGGIGFFYMKAVMSVRYFYSGRAEAVAVLVAVMIFCAGSATNPYFSGFDSLYLLGFIPLIAGFGKSYANK
jgi:hypothetical protein